MSLLHEIRFLAHFIRVGWRIASGRWYVFRDEPQWFVEEMAQIEPVDDTSELLIDAIQQAREELELRKRTK